jgi:hypothetical protein
MKVNFSSCISKYFQRFSFINDISLEVYTPFLDLYSTIDFIKLPLSVDGVFINQESIFIQVVSSIFFISNQLNNVSLIHHFKNNALIFCFLAKLVRSALFITSIIFFTAFESHIIFFIHIKAYHSIIFAYLLNAAILSFHDFVLVAVAISYNNLLCSCENIVSLSNFLYKSN